MQFVVYEAAAAAGPTLGLLSARGVLALDGLVAADAPQDAVEHLIDHFDELRPRLAALANEANATPVAEVRLRAPLPWPGKIVCSTAVYAPGAAAQRQQLLFTLKSAESVIGPGDTIRLPAVADSWSFVPQAALGLVMRGPAKHVAADAWRSAVFGYTCVVDVMARGDPQFGRDYWLAKSDTLGPLGPAIVTADEIADPSMLRVRSWQNGALAQEFAMADASHTIGEQVELATTVMTFFSGDLLVCGTSPEGQRPLADGDQLDVEIEPIGRLRLGAAALARSRA